MSNFDQILTSLNLCSSDTRDDALKSILKTVLFENGSAVSSKELIVSIKDIYGFEPHEQEVKIVLDILDDNNEIVIEGGKYKLHASELTKLKSVDYTAKREEEKRFINFKTFLGENFSIEEEDYEIIWKAFLQYLYQCFFHYGERANIVLNPKYEKEENQKFNNTDILYSIVSDLNRLDLAEILKFTVDNFNEFATPEDVDFVDAIGQKTLSFSSLGLDPAIIQDGFKTELIDWVLFLDTNFLFSILDLHVNIEDEACKELIKLLLSNPNYIKVKLYYSDLTLKELRHKKNDFTGIDESLTKSAIKALLRSDELDEFSRRFYESLLNDPDHTLHPSKIVDIADTSLRGKKIDIFSTNPQRNFLGEEYLNTRIVEYQRFINELNEIRRDYYHAKPIGRPPREVFRSEGQKEHDITLREIILLLRSSVKKKNDFKTLNQLKYFGVTLDELLIRFDTNEIRKKTTDNYPTFFKPSYLLNKFIKLLPVKTDNYKKAFIKAVSARGFYKDSKKSTDIIKLVSYLKKQGIDNEDLLLNLITEKVFLEKYREESNKDDFNEKEFIENEINHLYSQRTVELEETKRDLSTLKIEKQEDEIQKKKLQDTKIEKEELLSLYQKMINKLQQKVTTLETKIEKGISPPAMNFEVEEQRHKNFELETELKREKIKRLQTENKIRKPLRDKFMRRKLSYWQLRSVLYFFLTIAAFVIYIIILYSKHDNNANVSFLETIKDSTVLKITLWVFSLTLNVFTGKLVYDRFFNESFKKVYKEGLVYPENMKELIDVDELN